MESILCYNSPAWIVGAWRIMKEDGVAKIINISAYQFVAIEEAVLPELKASLLEVARANDLKGPCC